MNIFTKNINRRKFISRSGAAVAAIGAASTFSSRAFAQDYPSQDLSWMVHQAPGGLIDNTTRVALPYLKEQGFGASINYVSGASGRIARSQLYRSNPDGYTIMTDTSPDEVIGEVIFDGQYKVAEFQPIFGWYVNGFNLIVPKSSPLRTIEDFIAEAKKRRLTVGTFGKGNASHLQMEVVKRELGIDLQLVHFAGGAPAYAAVLGGHVDVAMGAANTAANAESVNFLTVFRTEREPALPDTPTIKESGFDIPLVNQVIYANAGPGIPEDRMAKLVEAFEKAFANPEHIEQQRKINLRITPLSSADIRALSDNAAKIAVEYKDALKG